MLDNVRIQLNIKKAPVLSEMEVLVTRFRFKVIKAILCAAREYDLEPLDIQVSEVRVPMNGTIATIRLLQS